jgi:hypothetical protein
MDIIQTAIFFGQLVIFFFQLRTMNNQARMISEQTGILGAQKKIIEDQLKLSGLAPKLDYYLNNVPNLFETPEHKGDGALDFYKTSLHKYDIDKLKGKLLFPEEIYVEIERIIKIQMDQINKNIEIIESKQILGPSNLDLRSLDDIKNRFLDQKSKLLKLLEDHIKLYS